MKEVLQDRFTEEERAWMARVGIGPATALRLKVHGHGRFDLPSLVTGNHILDALVDVSRRRDRWRGALRRARRREARQPVRLTGGIRRFASGR